MNIEEIRDFCLSKPEVTESFPFDNETLVFKVKGKMFLLAGINLPLSINVKCDPEEAQELREEYPSVQPGYHMNKLHWNTINVDGSIDDHLLYKWIEESYYLVASKLPIKERSFLLNQ
jgi:predicted DNA-binding protein (MmcQ/YjbR family)